MITLLSSFLQFTAVLTQGQLGWCSVNHVFPTWSAADLLPSSTYLLLVCQHCARSPLTPPTTIIWGFWSWSIIQGTLTIIPILILLLFYIYSIQASFSCCCKHQVYMYIVYIVNLGVNKPFPGEQLLIILNLPKLSNKPSQLMCALIINSVACSMIQ